MKPETARPLQKGRPLLLVSPEEDGMRLLRFLERRLGAPANILHRWIRTGQIRLNGHRSAPFVPLAGGDAVRLPPFAPVREETAPANTLAALAAAGLPPLAWTPRLLVLLKPGGLAAHPGCGQTDSVSRRLEDALAGQPYIPAPAHRLDRHTSGLILAGRTHSAQSRLQRAFARGDEIAKDYLAWVLGDWPDAGPCLLTDTLSKERRADGREVTRALPGGRTLPLLPASLPDVTLRKNPSQAHSLLIRVRGLSAGETPEALPPGRGACLLLIRLLTGRTHQIRAQTASRGLPVIGDGRHGGPVFPLMLLHAWHLRLSAALARDMAAPGNGPQDFTSFPDWPPPFLPDKEETAVALASLDALGFWSAFVRQQPVIPIPG
ncbi:MAG: RNA pseudouridine synthase [Desulfovibrio sp.]|jgi:23S rRNA pseudouridine955/2504/2580 synthase|nr:RNA pseudouridine synthase [Desulfovibrio sp.]